MEPFQEVEPCVKEDIETGPILERKMSSVPMDQTLQEDIETGPILKGQMPSVPMDQILHYVDHPELDPPLTIKNMVYLYRMMAEDEGKSSLDSSSDIFYSSSEEEKEEDVLLKFENQVISVTPQGIRIPNAFFNGTYLKNLVCVYLSEMNLVIQLQDGKKDTIPLPENVEGNEIIQAFEEWMTGLL